MKKISCVKSCLEKIVGSSVPLIVMLFTNSTHHQEPHRAAQDTAVWSKKLSEFEDDVLGKDLKATLSAFLKDTCDKPNVERLGRVCYIGRVPLNVVLRHSNENRNQLLGAYTCWLCSQRVCICISAQHFT